MTLLERIAQLKDDDRVELRQKVGGCWQIHSYPAKELKGIVPPTRQSSNGPGIFGGLLADIKEAPPGVDPYDRHLGGSLDLDWQRYGQIMNGNIPEPDADTPPDFNS